jgi:hypothetical protein
MFLRILNDDQKRALFVLAHHLVVSDHSVSKRESDLLDELSNGLRTKIPVTPQELHEEARLHVFDTREVRVAVMLEILILAYGDNAVPGAESEMISELARDLGFTDAEFVVMKSWGERSSQLLGEATKLMEAK